VTRVSLGINAYHTGNIGAFNEDAIEHVLTEIVEFVGCYPSRNPDGVVCLLANESVEHFGEPPNTLMAMGVPFL
jgi:hypothetical protein